MLRSIQSPDEVRSSIKVKHVQEKLNECSRLLQSVVSEIQEKFPKSIFENVDSHVYFAEDQIDNTNSMEDEESSQQNPTIDDGTIDTMDMVSSVQELSPPISPYPIRRDKSETDSISEISSQAQPFSPDTKETKRKSMKHEMMKLFKLTTGLGHNDTKSHGSKDGNDVLPLVTSIPKDPIHSLLLLFMLDLPDVLGIVSRLSMSADGCLAGATVHGEIFVYSRVPYSRHPDGITRGHDGGVVSLTWLTGADLKSFLITNGTDKKTLVWQVTINGIEGPHCELRQASVATCCCIHPVNKDVVIIGSLDNNVSMYKIERIGEGSDVIVRLNPLGIGTSFTKPITAISVSPDGRKLAVGSSLGTIGLYDLNTMSLDVEVDCRNRQGSSSSGRKVVGLNWSSDSTCVVVSSCDSRIRVVLVSDLSRRTKFKSNYFVNENLFLSAIFGPPDDERIVSVSESGYLCSWQLHTSSETNEACVHCDLLGSRQAKMNKEKDPSCEITAACIVPASQPVCDTIQAKTFNLGDGFRKNSSVLMLTCDTLGRIRVFAELFTPI